MKLARENQTGQREELSLVIKAMRQQIKDYGIEAHDLGFLPAHFNKNESKEIKAQRIKTKKNSKLAGVSSGKKVAPKYKDQNGNTWSRRGKRPRWLAQAVASGVPLETLLIAPSSANKA